MAIYLLKLGVDVNALNCKEQTAFDVVEGDASNSSALAIVPALLDAGSRRHEQSPPSSPEIHRIIEPTSGKLNGPNVPSSWPQKTSPKSPPQSHCHHHRLQHRWRDKWMDHHTNRTQGLRNARNKITGVAVLIATVTFSAGINPPGGLNQATGRAMMGRQTPFKVFMVCNIVALYSSLGIVIFLVTVVPFRPKSTMKLLVLTHKVTWVSTSFLALAYIAAIWTIMPRVPGTSWVLVALVSLGGRLHYGHICEFGVDAA